MMLFSNILLMFIGISSIVNYINSDEYYRKETPRLLAVVVGTIMLIIGAIGTFKTL